MNNNVIERRTSSATPTMVIPKCEPIENDYVQSSKRRLVELPSHEPESIPSNKRHMATKRSQQPDHQASKQLNGRADAFDDQQPKQTDSHSPKVTTPKSFPNSGNIENSASSNTQPKPR